MAGRLWNLRIRLRSSYTRLLYSRYPIILPHLATCCFHCSADDLISLVSILLLESPNRSWIFFRLWRNERPLRCHFHWNSSATYTFQGRPLKRWLINSLKLFQSAFICGTCFETIKFSRCSVRIMDRWSDLRDRTARLMDGFVYLLRQHRTTLVVPEVWIPELLMSVEIPKNQSGQHPIRSWCHCRRQMGNCLQAECTNVGFRTELDWN